MIYIFSPEECASIVSAFDGTENKVNEDSQNYYKNSEGLYNLPATLAYADRITKQVQKYYPKATFVNSYTRVYKRGSYLKIHTDREGLDITLSVCVEDKNNLEWPLYISAKKYKNKEWDRSTDDTEFKNQAFGIVIPVGQGAMMEGRKHPHWREELLCGESQRSIYVFYHWSVETKAKDKSITLLKSTVPDATVFGNFLDRNECQEIINHASAKLVASQVVDDKNGDWVSHEGRTSSGMHFLIGETPLIQKIEQRISDLTGIPVENGEGIQVLRYEKGQQYKPHFDYFPEDKEGSATHIKNGGQRIATFLMYLNTPESGGATIFPDAGLEVHAREGNALLFKYNTPTEDTKTLHGGTPVEAGVKWVATKWLRVNEFKEQANESYT